jgi:hypothetical protein
MADCLGRRLICILVSVATLAVFQSNPEPRRRVFPPYLQPFGQREQQCLSYLQWLIEVRLEFLKSALMPPHLFVCITFARVEIPGVSVALLWLAL